MTTGKAGGSKVGKFGIGVRVVDDEGDVGVIVGKRKGEREIDYDRYGKMWWPKDLLAVAANDNAAVAAEAGELQLAAGKFYRTRDGRKVGPMRRWPGSSGAYPWEDAEESDVWADNGDSGYSENHPDDLIAEWTDATPDTPSISPEIVVNDYSGAAGGENSSEWVPKVGDRVRVKDTDGLRHGMPVGAEGVVTVAGGGEYFQANLNHPSDGLIDQMVSKRNMESLPVAEQPAAEVDAEPTPFTIEAGKSYRTRDGRKADVLRDQGGWLAGDIVGGEQGKAWNRDGSHGGPYVNRIPSDDLVAEWVEPAAEVAVEASSEPATTKAKFKVGDRVKSSGNPWTEYTIAADHGEAIDVTVVEKDGSPGHTFYGQSSDMFSLAPDPAPLTTPTFARNDLVTLAAPVKVTGTSGDRVHISFPNGGSFTLPASALIAA